MNKKTFKVTIEVDNESTVDIEQIVYDGTYDLLCSHVMDGDINKFKVIVEEEKLT